MPSPDQIAAVALGRPAKRMVRLARDLQREVAQVTDGLQGELVAVLRVDSPEAADEVAELIRTEAANRPVSVLITRPTTAAPAAQED